MISSTQVNGQLISSVENKTPTSSGRPQTLEKYQPSADEIMNLSALLVELQLHELSTI